MSPLVTVGLCLVALSADKSQKPEQVPQPLTYAAAHKLALQTQKPLLVLVGADWCPACRHMENRVLPGLLKGGLLQDVIVSVVHFDKDRTLCQQLTKGGPIPQLLLFCPVKNGWQMKRLIGKQEPKVVLRFLETGIGRKSPSTSSRQSVPSVASTKPQAQQSATQFD